MVSFAAQLLADFDRDLENAARATTSSYVELVQQDRATPRDTGALAGGIKADPLQVSPGRISTLVKSTHQSDRGADVGTILDRSTGRLVEAKAYGHRAFGPISPPLPGGLEFIASFHVTTKHVGWWEQANKPSHLTQASKQMSRFDL